MQKIDLSQLKILPERDLPQQIDRFRNSGVLRLRAFAPKGLIGEAPLEGWLDFQLSMKVAWFAGDATDELARRAGKDCAVPAVITAAAFGIAVLALMFFADSCGGLFDTHSPNCTASNVWDFPLFTVPLAIAAIAAAWALVRLIRQPGGPDAMVEVPDEVWTTLASFGEAIALAKSGGTAPLGEQAISMGAGAIAGKVGEAISGPMIGATFKMLARDGTSDKESRIAEALELVRGNMLDAVRAHCTPV